MDKQETGEALFLFGQVLATKGALQAMEEHGVSPESLLKRHVHGDWRDLDEEEKEENELALKNQNHIFSAYQIADGVTIWLITEWDRSATTFLLPGEAERSQPMRQEDDMPTRIPGCESTDHEQCYGELWRCSECGKSVCYAEGTDNDPDLCDDCWVNKHHPPQVTADKDDEIGQQIMEPTVEPPDMETLAAWMWDSVCEATDGCIVEHDGHCVHGFPSWFLELGLI